MFLYDSVNPGGIPAHAELVAGYVDGLYANVTQLKAKFPKATVVSITVKGNTAAHVADCETGDLTPSSVAYWALEVCRLGRRPTIYCSAATWPAVEAELLRHRLHPSAVDWWAASWLTVGTEPDPHVNKAQQFVDYFTHPVGVPVCWQFASDAPGPDGRYDGNVTNGEWPGVN
jgi:hypothetical protein